MSSEHKGAHKAPLLFCRKFLDEAITGEEIGARPRCKTTARERVSGVGLGGCQLRRAMKGEEGSEKLRGGGRRMKVVCLRRERGQVS